MMTKQERDELRDLRDAALNKNADMETVTRFGRMAVEQIPRCLDDLDAKDTEITRLKAALAKARGALDWYADHAMWCCNEKYDERVMTTGMPSGSHFLPVKEAKSRAREALADIDKIMGEK